MKGRPRKRCNTGNVKVRFKTIYSEVSGVTVTRQNRLSGVKLLRSGKIRINLYVRRLEYGMTLRELCEVVKQDTGVSADIKRVREYENCAEDLKEEVKVAICRVLGLKVEEIEKIEEVEKVDK